ncbi:MAG: hypothetical protein ACRER5_24030, partial [Pseudomonas sp.]
MNPLFARAASTRWASTLLSMLVLWAPFGSYCHAAGSARELRVYNWVEYLPRSVLEDFQHSTGIKVTYDVYDTGEVLEA